MAYTKQDFQSNTTLYASELNTMDDQIALNETNISTIDSAVTDISTRLTNVATQVNTNTSNISTINTRMNSVASEVTANANTLNDHDDRLTDLEANVASLNPEARVTISKDGGRLIITAYGLTSGNNYIIKLKRKPNRKSYTKEWISVDNYGFGMMSGATDSATGSIIYGDVPSWMPNGGYLASSWSFTADATTYSMTLNTREWLLDLLKPINNTDFKGVDGEAVGIIGIPTGKPYRMLPFTFCLYDSNDNLIVQSNDIAYINGKSDQQFLQLQVSGSVYAVHNVRITIK